jgi:isopentenyl-diphosphate delta-isomerase
MTSEDVDIELVDQSGKIIARGKKYEIHKNPVPLHRAISVVIFDPKHEKMLIQQRAGDKPTWPLFWSNAVCTHPLPGETYKDAAERRLQEELGFLVPLKEIFRFTYKAQYDETWGENEYDVVFGGEYDGEIKPNPEEVADYQWIDIKKLKKDILENPAQYSPWFKIILKRL